MRWLLVLISLIFFISVAIADDRVLEISFSFTPGEGKEVVAYKLFQDDEPVCTSPIANVSDNGDGIQVFDCAFNTSLGLHDYMMSAVYSDASESSRSPSYSFLISKGSWKQTKAKGRFQVRAKIQIDDLK